MFGHGNFASVRIGHEGINHLAGVSASIASLNNAGINVIVDDVIHDTRVLRAAVEALADLPVLFVELHLPRDIAEQRERDRGNIVLLSGALAFYDLSHAYGSYDLALDSSRLSAEACALQIMAVVLDGHLGRTFRDLRRQFSEPLAQDM